MAVEKDLKPFLVDLKYSDDAKVSSRFQKIPTGPCPHGRHQAQAGRHERKRRRGQEHDHGQLWRWPLRGRAPRSGS